MNSRDGTEYHVISNGDNSRKCYACIHLSANKDIPDGHLEFGINVIYIQ